MTVEKKTLLVIDDNEDTLEIVTRMLQNTEFEVTVSNTAQAGIELARQIHPDIVLLDLMMPEIDGFTALKYIHQTAGHDIKIVYLTGKKTSDGMSIARKVGAVDYITKPFTASFLLEHLRKALL